MRFFSESVTNIILNEMNHRKLESDGNYRVYISGLVSSRNCYKKLKFVYRSDHEKSINFILLEFFMSDFILSNIFHTFAKKEI